LALVHAVLLFGGYDTEVLSAIRLPGTEPGAGVAVGATERDKEQECGEHEPGLTRFHHWPLHCKIAAPNRFLILGTSSTTIEGVRMTSFSRGLVLAKLGAFAAAGLSLVAQPSDASACGACFAPPGPPTVVSGHRMVMSISMTQTVLWD